MPALQYRVWGARALSYGIGALCALWLYGALKPPVTWLPKPKGVPVRVAVQRPALPAKPVVSAPESRIEQERAPAPPPVPVKPKILPLRGESAPAKQEKVLPSMPGARPIETSPAPPEQTLSEQPLPTLSQPPIAPPVQAMAELPPILPPVPSGPLPPMPPEGEVRTYPEAPGGNVLVLELTVNDRGVVVDARILVPSANALSDLTLTLASKGQYWTHLDPPMAPGELRKLEVRIPYADGQPSFNLP